MQGSAEHSAAEEMAGQGLLATGTGGRESYAVSSPLADPNPTLFDPSRSLREAAAARVAAHRSRRAGAQAMETAREEALRLERAQFERDNRRGASRVRDTVRARYENTQSYREFLAAEAERATQQARAEAEVAARNAKAIADAQLKLLEELRQNDSIEEAFAPSEPSVFSPEGTQRADLDRWPEEPESMNPFIVEASASSGSVTSAGPHKAERRDSDFASPEIRHPQTGDLFDEPWATDSASVSEITSGGLTVRLYDELNPMVTAPRGSSMGRAHAEDAAVELEELEQEIAFRRAPEFTHHIFDTLPIPANLIEFPRELVAARKARPRLAEGPLREELAPEPQLRIFEVEPETISTAPAAPEETSSGAPVWQGLLLDTPRTRLTSPQQQRGGTVQLEDIAPISRRLMAATVDACCVGAAFVAFVTTVAYVSGPRLQALSNPGSRTTLAAGIFLTLAISTLLYQLLFFSLNDATPGMRYARIGLCTFSDVNPTRGAMRRRVLATVLAACPLGLGLLWAWLDDDRLGWHDRISRMYHRSY